MKRFDELFQLLRRRWRYGAVTSIAFFFVPLFGLIYWVRPTFGMVGLGEDPSATVKWSEWLIWISATCYIASTAVTIATGVCCMIASKWLISRPS